VSEVSSKKYDQELSRSLTLLDSIFITLSSISPASSVFLITPTLILALAGASVLALLLGAVIGLFAAVTYAELASKLPITGGEYTWAARLQSKGLGFATFFLNVFTAILILGVFSVGLSQLLPAVIPALTGSWVPVAIVVITIAIACLTIKTNAIFTGICLTLELLALVYLCFLGFSNSQRGFGEFFNAQTLDESGSLSSVSIVIVMSLLSVAIFTYNGYGAAAYFAEETKDPKVIVPKSVIVSFFATIAITLLPVMAVIVGAPDITEMLASGDPMGYFLSTLGGDTAAKIVLSGVAIAIFNAIIAIEIAVARLVYASARDKSWPNAVDNLLSKVSAKTQAPVSATLFVGIVVIVISLTVPFDWLVLATGSSLVFGYTIVAISALNIRKTGRDGYNMPLFPIPPLVVIASMIYVAIESWKADSTPVIIAIAVLAIGALWYYGFIRNARGERWTLPDPQDS